MPSARCSCEGRPWRKGIQSIIAERSRKRDRCCSAGATCHPTTLARRDVSERTYTCRCSRRTARRRKRRIRAQATAAQASSRRLSAPRPGRQATNRYRVVPHRSYKGCSSIPVGKYIRPMKISRARLECASAFSNNTFRPVAGASLRMIANGEINTLRGQRPLEGGAPGFRAWNSTERIAAVCGRCLEGQSDTACDNALEFCAGRLLAAARGHDDVSEAGRQSLRMSAPSLLRIQRPDERGTAPPRSPLPTAARSAPRSTATGFGRRAISSPRTTAS